MIPTKTTTAEVTSNLTGKTGKFQIDAAAMAHVMGVLSKLYSDEQLAVIREYSTNARDSHKEAGQTRPIEISLPSSFRRTLIIRDFGIGMDADDLEETYSHYGKSTKTSSNLFNGMLGMGSKSALAYTNSFTVVGRKNGVITKAIISKDDQSIPEFTIVHSGPTDEENGVEIQIPVRHTTDFVDKAKEFFKWWEAGTALVNGQDLAGHGLKEMDGIHLSGTFDSLGRPSPVKVYASASAPTAAYYNNDEVTIVMGDVPYPVNRDYMPNTNLGIKIAVYVPIGTVEFTPSREALVYNNELVRAIKGVHEEVRQRLFKEACKEIVEAPTHKEAMNLWSEPPRIVRNDYSNWQSMTYQGEPFKGYVSLAETGYSVRRDYNDRLRLNEFASIQKSDCQTTALIVTGVESKPTTSFKRKVMKYASDNGISNGGRYDNTIVLLDSDITSPWFQDIKRVDKATIDAVKFPRPPKDPNAPAKPRAAVVGYDAWEKTASGPVKHPNATKMPTSNVVYYHNSDLKGKDVKAGDILAAVETGTTLVELGKGRLAKFLKSYPSAKHLNTVIYDHAKKHVDGLTDLDYETRALGYTMMSFLNALDNVTDVKDPDLQKLATVVRANKGGRAQSTDWEKAHAIAMTAYRITGKYDLYTKVRDGVKSRISEKYPLIHQNRQDHSLIYVNAVYEAMYK